MFKIREIIDDGRAEVSNRQLPALFPDRATAIAHIEMLQSQFFRRGRDLEHDYWWAQDEQTGECYRWTVE